MKARKRGPVRRVDVATACHQRSVALCSGPDILRAGGAGVWQKEGSCVGERGTGFGIRNINITITTNNTVRNKGNLI